MRSFCTPILAAPILTALGAAAPVFALPPATVVDATIYLAGSSAMDPSLEYAIRRVCVNTASLASKLDLYRFSLTDRAWTCETNNTLIPGIGTGSGSGGNVRIAFVKNSRAEAGIAIDALLGGPVVSYLSPLVGMTCAGSVPVPAQGPFAQLNDNRNCVGGFVSLTVPQIVFSTVEPNKLTTASLTGLVNVVAVNHQVMGVPVSLNLYRALQANQGLTQDDEYANMPSLTATTVANAYSGNLADWIQIMDKDSNSLGLPSSADSTVKVCRGTDRTDIQALAETHFLRQRCMPGVVPVLPADGAGGSGTGGTSPGTTSAPNFLAGNVYAGASSYQIRDCLHAADTAGYFAIGILATECTPGNCSAATARNYRYVKVDGAAPTLIDTLSARYPFYGESYLLNRVTLSGPALAFRNRVGLLLSDAGVIAQTNTAAFLYKFGDSGVLAMPDQINAVLPMPPYTQASVRAQPVNSTSKLGNSCQIAPVIQGTFVIPDVRAVVPQGN